MEEEFTQTETKRAFVNDQMMSLGNQWNQILQLRKMLNCRRERRPYRELKFRLTKELQQKNRQLRNKNAK